MKTKTQNNTKLAIHTIKNASVSVLLAILTIVFTLVRTGLTSYAYGLDSLGLLALAISILPYISGGHNSFINMATAKLYKPMHLKDYEQANAKIANLKPQFYIFGIVYLAITFILAFAFPFIAGGNTGLIVISHEGMTQNIFWWQSTIFILSNSIELISTYFIIPISVILLFIVNKSYITNGYNILFTILFNAIIIVLFVLQIQGIVHISFIVMNIIVIALLGSKILFVLCVLYPYRKKHFSWFQRKKASTWKIKKETWQSVVTSYLDQFSTDIITILFLVYAAVKTSDMEMHIGHSAIHQHGGHGGGGFAPDGFVPASVYFVFMTLLTSGNEIVHSIIDAAIPSLAEHATHNDTRINKHFFHRFQMLNIFIASFTITNFILTAPFLNSVLMVHDHGDHVAGVHEHVDLIDTATLNIFIGLLWIPMLIEIFSAMHRHILVMYGEFKKTAIISGARATFLLIAFCIIGAIIFTSVNEQHWTYAIYGTIISCGAVANLITYLMARKAVSSKIVATDGCVHMFTSTLLCFVWTILSLVIMIPLTITQSEEIIDLTHDLHNVIPVIAVGCGIGLCNMVINVFNIYWFRRDDFMYYYQEVKDHIKQPLNNNI